MAKQVQTSQTLAQQNSEAEHWKSKALRQRLKELAAPLKVASHFKKWLHTFSRHCIFNNFRIS